jgi:hypothetical protein
MPQKTISFLIAFGSFLGRVFLLSQIDVSVVALSSKEP